MGTSNTVVCVLGAVLVFTGLCIKLYNHEMKALNGGTYDRDSERKLRRRGGRCVFFGCVLAILSFAYTQVPTGYTGVLKSMGQINEASLEPGIHFQIPFVQSIDCVNNKQQDVLVKSRIWGETSEKQSIYVSNVTVTYQVRSDKSVWLYQNVDNFDVLINESLIEAATKRAMAKLSVDDASDIKIMETTIKSMLTESLEEKYGKDTVTVVKVVVPEIGT